MTKIDKLRLGVFKIWFFTLVIIIIVYGLKFVEYPSAKSLTSSVIQSLQMMVGLVLPQISMMTAFYLNFDRQKEKFNSLSNEQVKVIIWLSVFYHVIFVIVLIAGVMFYAFDKTINSNDVCKGQLLQSNTAYVMTIMGLFSVFIAPVGFLFAKPKESQQDDEKQE